ncbi:hypothetical protein ABW20_dc0107917 [Dactylellina cionopaga]|nr:hypothetical protein ABW20_dc0107917 [Dactylellina cionopaga]
MSSVVTVKSVEFVNNPAKFSDIYHFRITFDCTATLADDIEWKLIYVPSPQNEDLNQILDEVLVGPVPSGVSTFAFDAPAPEPSKIPEEDLMGVAALIVVGSYLKQEFLRVGYYQNTQYSTEEMRENPPDKPDIACLVRDINRMMYQLRQKQTQELNRPYCSQPSINLDPQPITAFGS